MGFVMPDQMQNDALGQVGGLNGACRAVGGRKVVRSSTMHRMQGFNQAPSAAAHALRVFVWGDVDSLALQHTRCTSEVPC